MSRVRVLVIEDEAKLANVVARGLREEGYAVDIAERGEDALWMARAAAYDAIMLDVMLPGADGFEVCRRLRELGVWSPVLMLTARDAVEDRVNGLDAGADDYLVKPFSFEELLARLRALVRRVPGERPTVVEVGDLRLDPAARRAWRGERELDLSVKEFALLELFMRRPGKVLSRSELLDGAWDLAFERRSNVVDVYMGYLRAKVDKPFGSDSLETVRGVGLQAAGERVNRLPIRLRLTLAFALVVAVVLAGMGTFVYQRVGDSLLESVDATLDSQADEAALDVRRGDVRDLDVTGGTTLAQVVDSTGACPALGAPRPWAPAAHRGRSRGGHRWPRAAIGLAAHSARQLARARHPEWHRPARWWLVARSLDPREDSLDRLLRQLLVATPFALLLASLARLRARRSSDAPRRGHAAPRCLGVGSVARTAPGAAERR